MIEEDELKLQIRAMMREIEKLREDVRYWQATYLKMKEQVDMLSLDLGLRDKEPH